jgi:DNA-binding transcriptional LysR family regulator
MQEDPFRLKKIRFLMAVYETRSISKAGETVRLSPPAASRCLEELREYFQDALFVVNRRQTLPTKRFLELLPSFTAILQASEDFNRAPFDISKIRTRFRFSCTSAFAASLVNFVLPRMMEEAPLASLEHVSLPEYPILQLMSGKTDLLVTRAVGLPSSAHMHALTAGRRVLLLRKNHPLELLSRKRPLVRADLRKYRRISLTSGRRQDWRGPEQGVFTEADDAGLVAFRTDRPQHGWRVMQKSDLIMVCTVRSARMAIVLYKQLTFIALPSDVSDESAPKVAIIWSELTHRDPEQIWFRNLVLEWDRAWESAENDLYDSLFPGNKALQASD